MHVRDACRIMTRFIMTIMTKVQGHAPGGRGRGRDVDLLRDIIISGRGVRIMLEKVADSARKAVKLAEPCKPYAGQFLEFCSISLSTYQTCTICLGAINAFVWAPDWAELYRAVTVHLKLWCAAGLCTRTHIVLHIHQRCPL